LTTSTLETATEVHPFHVEVTEDVLTDLRRRIAATRWPEKETIAYESQGVQLATMQELVRYWGTEYDFRRFEARLNALPQFITEIDGLDIHFIHVESPHALATGGPAPSGLSAEESRAWEQLKFLYTRGIGYATEMNLRPQTLYGLADSPVALAAWMLDHDARSYEDIARAFEGDPMGSLTRDEVLDNITLTWVTNTGVSSGHLYWENTLGFFDVKGVTVPAAVSVFPRELYQAPRSWAEQAYPNLIYFNAVDKDNHFAAWQEPELFTTEVRAAFRSLRPNGRSS